jgi:hypothetical protein
MDTLKDNPNIIYTHRFAFPYQDDRATNYPGRKRCMAFNHDIFPDHHRIVKMLIEVAESTSFNVLETSPVFRMFNLVVTWRSIQSAPGSPNCTKSSSATFINKINVPRLARQDNTMKHVLLKSNSSLSYEITTWKLSVSRSFLRIVVKIHHLSYPSIIHRLSRSGRHVLIECACHLFIIWPIYRRFTIVFQSVL